MSSINLPRQDRAPDGDRSANSSVVGPNAGWRDADVAWNMIGSFVSGPIAWGGIGWLLDRWLDTAPLFIAIGAVIGFVLGFYLVIMRGGGFSPARPPSPYERTPAQPADDVVLPDAARD